MSYSSHRYMMKFLDTAPGVFLCELMSKDKIQDLHHLKRMYIRCLSRNGNSFEPLPSPRTVTLSLKYRSPEDDFGLAVENCICSHKMITAYLAVYGSRGKSFEEFYRKVEPQNKLPYLFRKFKDYEYFQRAGYKPTEWIQKIHRLLSFSWQDVVKLFGHSPTLWQFTRCIETNIDTFISILEEGHSLEDLRKRFPLMERCSIFSFLEVWEHLSRPDESLMQTLPQRLQDPKAYEILLRCPQENLKKYIPFEIIKLANPIAMMNQVIDRLRDCDGFFQVLPDLAKNDCDVFLTPVPKGVVDSDRLGVCYGKYHDYVWYSWQDLEESFFVEDEFLIPRIPDKPNDRFRKEHVAQLKNLRVSLVVKELLKYPIGVPVPIFIEDNEVVSKFSLRIVNLGLYFRRWNGDPDNLPLREHQTEGLINEVTISETFQKLDDLFIDSIEVCEIAKKLQVKSMYSKDFWTFYQIVRQGEYCIRMASKIFIEKGCFLYRKIHGVNPYGINPSHIEEIM